MPHAPLVSVVSKALMWLLKAVDLPWILHSTNQLAPRLHRIMTLAQQRFGDIRRVRWG